MKLRFASGLLLLFIWQTAKATPINHFSGCFDAGNDPALINKQVDLFKSVFSFTCNTGTVACPRYSQRTCTGNFAENRACRFRNLYYNIAARQFEYYSCPTDMPTPMITGHRYWSPQFQAAPNTTADPWRDGHMQASFIHKMWTSLSDDRFVRIQSAPPPAKQVHLVSGLSVLWSAYKASRFGHFWVDNMYPIIQMMRNFDVVTHNFTLFVEADAADTTYQSLLQAYFASMSTEPVVLWPLAPGAIATPYILFDDVLIGNGFYALENIPDMRDKAPLYNYWSMSSTWWEMRSHVYRGLGLDPLSKPSRHRVVINGYQAKRAIRDTQGLKTYLELSFPGLEVLVRDFKSMTFHDQLTTLADTTVFITTEGGPGYRHIFMPEGAVAIIISAPSADQAHRSLYSPYHELDRYFSQLHYINYFAYPVKQSNTQEYVLWTTKRERAASIDAHNKLCIYNSDINVNHTRMGALVQQALFEVNIQRAYQLH